MGKYKQVKEEYTVGDGLDTSDIESLKDEMQEWVDNLGGTALENTSRYQTASDAVDVLNRVDDVDFDDLWKAVKDVGDGNITEDTIRALKYTVIIFKPKSRRQSTSRAYRLNNAISVLDGAFEAVERYLEPYASENEEKVKGIKGEIDELSSTIHDMEVVEFPGMYG